MIHAQALFDRTLHGRTDTVNKYNEPLFKLACAWVCAWARINIDKNIQKIEHLKFSITLLSFHYRKCSMGKSKISTTNWKWSSSKNVAEEIFNTFFPT